jgi:molecular chaperone GrpE
VSDEQQDKEGIQAELAAGDVVEPDSAEDAPVDGEVGEGENGDPEVLLQELEQARAKEAEYLDGWQRARAELANARKRFERERQQSYANAKADMLTRLLPIVDDFGRAVEILPPDIEGLTWVEGVLLVQRKLQSLLDQDGVVPIEAVDQEFDPLFHQAVTYEPSEKVAMGCVIEELQTGYRMGDRVLRPSMVRVSSGPPPEAEPQVTEESEQEDEEQT